MDLFDQEQNQKNKPLAARMRPRNLDEFIGQEHIVGKGRLLRRAISADQLTSVIFYGPPGTGKTTLAKVIANHTRSHFITLNAVLTGVQNIRDAIKNADDQYKLYNKRTILFVDEVHRWNKSQQDALLPWVENGTIILVGATTENPFFEVNKALVSRSRVFQLKPLEKWDLEKAVSNALSDTERGYGKWNVQIEKSALDHLIETANGDARNLLNALELAVETTPEVWPPKEGKTIFINKETAEESIQKKVVLYDRDGDYHYDIISAFIKSLRGRDPDAALYWMARMLSAGEDPHYIFRRMLISACEDTGLADPHALSVVESCAAAFDRIGLPEGRYMLTQAALYLATAPKSNSSMAFFDALQTVQKEDAEVPNHLRDNSRDAEGFGHGAGYLYPHAYKDHWVAQQYLPDALNGRVFYTPSDQGYEKNIRQDVLSRRELQISAILEEMSDDDLINPEGSWWQAERHRNGFIKKEENLTFTPKDKALEQWQKRTDEGRSETLLQIRNELLGFAELLRHSRNLVVNADDGLFIWEIMRQSPEGFSGGLCKTEKGMNILTQYAQTLPQIDRPVLATNINFFEETVFDNVFFKDPFLTKDSIDSFLSEWLCKKTELFSPKTKFFIAQKIPCKGQKLSKIISRYGSKNFSDSVELKSFLETEEKYFSSENHPIFGWSEESVNEKFSNQEFFVSYCSKEIFNNRYIKKSDIENWFDAEKSEYGKFMAQNLGATELQFVQKELISIANKRILVDWLMTYAFFMVCAK